MERYVIKEIYADGYERIAVIESINCGMKFTVHFLECDEYVEYDEVSQKRKKGDTLEGQISIELIAASKKVEEEIMHEQTIPESSHIEAIVQVYEVIDHYSLYAFSSIIKDKIVVEFEHTVDYTKGDNIYIRGSLEMSDPQPA